MSSFIMCKQEFLCSPSQKYLISYPLLQSRPVSASGSNVLQGSRDVTNGHSKPVGLFSSSSQTLKQNDASVEDPND